MPYYLNKNLDGLLSAKSNGDGYSINLHWATAYPNIRTNTIAYNIYMSNDIAPVFPINFFSNYPSFVYIDGYTNVNILDLIPGDLYHFAVRAIEYNKSFFDITTLPQAYNGLVVLPQSLLSSNISSTDGYVPLVDVSEFPNNSNGVVRVGAELINYTSVDYVNNKLILSNPATQRGYNGSIATSHNVDGYDGFETWNPNVIFWPIEIEEQNTRVFECWNRFDVGHNIYTNTDGYRQKIKDILTTNLTYSDEVNTGFPAYDFSGYHRTDPVLLLNGTCVGSYIGGQVGCADSYAGVGLQLRGLNVQDANLQRQEVLLSVDGEPVCLVKRRWTGITCKCMLPYNEYPDARCVNCYGSGFVVGYNQFFNPRQSDGRIMVRFDPSADDLKATTDGLESELLPNCWTLAVPTLKDRDFIVRFDEDGNEEFRYEILNVTRNKLLLNMTGMQRFALQRIRKTDPIYQVKVFRNTSNFPVNLATSSSSSLGIPNHSHSFVFNENSPPNASQLTSTDAGHNHVIHLDSATGNLVVSVELGHTHLLS